MTQTNPSIALAMAIRQCEMSTKWVGADRIAKLTAEELLFRPGPDRNHIYWIFGHIVTNADIAPYLDGSDSSVNPKQRALFGMGSMPADRADVYPPIEQLVAQFEKATGDSLKALRAMQEGDLSLPPATDLPEQLRQFFPDRASLAVGFAMHTAYHAGQIGTVLKLLGK
jgi:hypothetical protein